MYWQTLKLPNLKKTQAFKKKFITKGEKKICQNFLKNKNVLIEKKVFKFTVSQGTISQTLLYYQHIKLPGQLRELIRKEQKIFQVLRKN